MHRRHSHPIDDARPFAVEAADAGFTLIEALVALAILSMVVLGFLGMRTEAMADAAEARNWRLAREIAEEVMSELQAGAREVKPDSGVEMLIEKYPDFKYVVLIGDEDISEWESMMAGDVDSYSRDSGASQRLQWRRDRDDLRVAQQKGLSLRDYRERRLEEREAEEERVPSESEFEDVMVIVTFPRVRLLEDVQPEPQFKIKAKVSTLAIEGYTPDEAQAVAAARGDTPGAAGTTAAGGGGTPSSGGDR